jgi:hypothetical protein
MSSTKPFFQPVPDAPATYVQQWAIRLVAMVNTLLRKANGTADLTLTPSATSTVMTDARLSAVSVLTFMPTTAHAATAKTSIYVTAQKQGQATINHASSANSDQTFRVALHG